MSRILIKPLPLADPLEIMIEGCRNKDPHCQEMLYKHCYPDMIRICYRYAGDTDGAGIIFNNAMLKVFSNIHKYTEKGKLMGWVKTIVINACIDLVKQQNKFREVFASDVNEYDINMDADILHSITVKEIRKIIQQLPKATAAVFNLYIYEGFTHKQIAESLGISEGTSKWHVNEGRKLLKAKVEHFIKPTIKKNAAG